MEILSVASGLLILIVVNIVLGCTKAYFEQCFNIVKLRQGLIKGLIIFVCFCAVYLAGYINPDVIAVNVGGVSYTLMEAIYLVVFGGYLSYAYQVIYKLSKMLSNKTEVVAVETKTGDKQ